MGHPHLHHHHARQEADTVVAMVYVTQEATFDGPIAGYKTIGGDDDGAVAFAPEPTTQALRMPPPEEPPRRAPTRDEDPTPTKERSTKQTTTSKSRSSSAADKEKATPSPRKSPKSAAVDATSSSDDSSPTSDPTADLASATASSSSAPGITSSTSSQGMSGGAKAGIAFAVIAGIAALAVLIFLLYRRKMKKNEAYRKADDEKSSFVGDRDFGRQASTRTARTASTAPRLSLRPVTEFLPNLVSTNNKIGGAPAGYRNTPAESSQPQENPFGTEPAQYQPNNPHNPFGLHAEQSRSVGPEVNAPAPMTQPSLLPPSASRPEPSAGGTAAGAAFVGGAAAAGGVAGMGAAAGAGNRQIAPKPLSIRKTPSPDAERSTSPPQGGRNGDVSPTGTEFSMTSMPGTPMSSTASMLATGGAVGSSVHRVQLDFKPSMDDELELKAGQLVRLLHEYDDGWALCIRLDRSQQGVSPRTCLSTRPVKPRPSGPSGPPPPGAAGRGPGPGMRLPIQGPGVGPPPNMRLPIQGHGGAPRGSMASVGGRPPDRPYSNQPRSMSPGPGRNSPGPYGRSQSPAPYSQPPRSHSPAASMNGRNSPGPSYGRPPRAMSPAGHRSRSNSAMSQAGAGPGGPGAGGRRSRANSAAGPQIGGYNRSPPGPSTMNPNVSPPQAFRRPNMFPSAATAQRAEPTTMTDAPPQLSSSPPTRKPVPGQAL
ncbi:MAG: hypothetical protein M1825_002530 [Sarcosagium campestre]|nr:MAG: hypothetical protein M1825_002530 [Sarcosagium campestre]